MPRPGLLPLVCGNACERNGRSCCCLRSKRRSTKSSTRRRVIHLARIELDLGLITDAQIGRLSELIHQQLLEKLRSIAITRSSSRDRGTPEVRSDKRQNRLTILLHYLRTGSLPWEAVRPADETPKVVQEMKQTCCEQWDEVQQTLRSEQLPMPCFFRLLQLIGPAEAHRLPVLLEEQCFS